MAIVAVRDLSGIAEPLPGFVVTRSNGLEGEKSLSITGLYTETNRHGYRYVKNENIIWYKNEEYIIKNYKEKTYKNGKGITATALHRIFDDLINYRIYEEISGTFRIEELLKFAFKGSGYTFEVDNTNLKTSVRVENFGWDNTLSLFRSILEKFGAEFDYSGKHIFVAKKIGTYKDSPIMHHKLNVSEPEKEIDTSNFATYIRGYGAQDEKGKYLVQAEYTSPLAAVYGIKHAEPVKDERFKDKDSLLTEMKNKLGDSLDISLTFTAVELEDMGFHDVNKGDSLWCVIEPLDINVQLRVLSIEDYSNDRKSPVFTFGSISKKASDIIADFNTTKKTVDKVVDQSTGKIKDSALSKAGLVLKTDFDRHVSNSNIHVTADEKAVWNSKEKEGAADAALQASREYTDDLERKMAAAIWMSPQLKNGWKQYTSSDGIFTIQYMKDITGTVYIRGAIAGGTVGASAPAFTLPAGFRPPFPHFYSGVASSAGTGSSPQTHRTRINTNGDVLIESCSNTANPNVFISINTQFKTI
ncbi:phage tail protein [Bacillus velezensis]|uniref:phage tail protein n=1 Tax=Bacillus velezensis TaxID=492670 RepID=UPI00374722C2